MSKRWKGLFAVSAGCLLAYRHLVRPWQEGWGATDDEMRTPLPGDELVEEPAGQTTRAITIDATPADVWPWLIQLGADRGGFYSYDRVEDVFGLGIHSVDRIVPEWQTRSVGDVVYGDARRTGGWYVMEIRPTEALVLKTANLEEGRPARRDDRPAFFEFAWIFILRARSDSTTRLLVRERVAFGSRIARVLMSSVGLVSFVMTRKMMLGIKERAEATSEKRSVSERVIPA